VLGERVGLAVAISVSGFEQETSEENAPEHYTITHARFVNLSLRTIEIQPMNISVIKHFTENG
jgi:hypothetical protein